MKELLSHAPLKLDSRLRGNDYSVCSEQYCYAFRALTTICHFVCLLPNGRFRVPDSIHQKLQPSIAKVLEPSTPCECRTESPSSRIFVTTVRRAERFGLGETAAKKGCLGHPSWFHSNKFILLGEFNTNCTFEVTSLVCHWLRQCRASYSLPSRHWQSQWHTTGK